MSKFFSSTLASLEKDKGKASLKDALRRSHFYNLSQQPMPWEEVEEQLHSELLFLPSQVTVMQMTISQVEEHDDKEDNPYECILVLGPSDRPGWWSLYSAYEEYDGTPGWWSFCRFEYQNYATGEDFGKVVIVPEHWRGDPKLGVKDHRYKVTS